MKKKLLVGSIGVVVLGATFYLGGHVGANSNWQTEVTNNASARIGNVGYIKKEELLKKSIGDQMNDVLAPTLQEHEQDLERLLEEYYQMKIAGLADTPEFKAIEQQIITKKNEIYNRYKAEIDQAFTGK